MANFLKQSCVLALFSLVISSAANADEFEQVNSLAFEIQSSAGQLLSNTEPYRNATNYTQLVEHCGRLQQGATELVNLVRHETDIYIVEAKVNQLDECFQQLPSLVIGAEFEASQGRGIISGDTTPFKQLLERTDQGIYYLLETVTLIRNRIEQVQAPGQIVAGGEILIPIQPPVLQQQFGHLPHGNGLGIQFNSFGGSFGNQQRLDEQRRQAEQQRRQAEQRRQQADQLRRRLDDQRRQADQQRRQTDQRRQQEQQRRQADQQRQRQDEQRRQADQQRRQADQRRQQEQQRRQADQQRQRQADQRRQQEQQRRQADQQRQQEQQRRQADQQRQRQEQQRRQADQQRRQAEQQRRQAEQQRRQADQRRRQEQQRRQKKR